MLRAVGLLPGPIRALAVVVLVIGLSAGSCLKNADDGARLATARGGSKLSTGVKVWDDMGRVRGLTVSAGEQLQSGARRLSDDPEVQEATLAVAWKATCGVIFGEVQFERGSIARFVVDLAATYGIEFLNDGEAVIADTVLQVVDSSANDAAEKCDDLREAGF
jgi:hypothetical protein